MTFTSGNANGSSSRDERNNKNLAPYAAKPAPYSNGFIVEQPYPIGELLSKDKYPQNATPPKAFTPLTIRGVTYPHRLWVSPMCMCESTRETSPCVGFNNPDSSDNGHATDFHFVRTCRPAWRQQIYG